MWISKPVYATLPTAYVLGGIAAIAYSGNVLGASFGVLLALTGTVVWKMRNEAKTRSLATKKVAAKPRRLRL